MFQTIIMVGASPPPADHQKQPELQMAMTSTQQVLHRMTDLHYAILDAIIAGAKDADIARKLDIHPSTIRRLRQSPTFQLERTRRRMELESKILEAKAVEVLSRPEDLLEQSAREAAQRLIDGLSSDDSKESLDSALEILDRTGRGKVTKQQSTSVSLVGILSAEEVAAIKAGIADLRADREAKAVDSTVVTKKAASDDGGRPTE